MKATNLKMTNIQKQLIVYIDKHYLPGMNIEAFRTIKKMAIDTLDIPEVRPFSDYLFRLIDNKGFNDVYIYKKATIDRKLFSKIKTVSNYQPSKHTIFKFILALECNTHEAKELLEHAGYAFFRSSKFDLVILYAVEHEIYDIMTVNELLFDMTNETL